MPWHPEVFSVQALERVLDRAEPSALVPFFAGLMTGEVDAIMRTFAGEPEVHHPIRGRVKGVAAFERFAAETNAWMAEHDVTVKDAAFIVTPTRKVEEAVLVVDGADLPVAVAADVAEAGLTELRVYFSTWPLTGGHAIRPPLLQRDPGLEEADVVGEYQRALAAGDADAVLAAFEPGASVREPAGAAYAHRGTDELRALYELFFSNGGGIALEHCSVTDDGRACALEYNVVAWGRTPMPPQAGLAVYVRGESGKLAAARIYDDADPPL